MSIEQRVNELEDRVNALEQKLNKPPQIQKDDLRSFVEEVNPSDHYERAVAIGYYLEHLEEQENFSSNDIEEGYDRCKEKKYSNTATLLRRIHENKGWIMKDEKDGNTTLWKTTGDGEDMVEEAMEDES
jgi:hypothetical protein